MSINGISNSGQVATGQAQNAFGNADLGKEDFLKLLVAQMTHQDPMSPLENTEMVAQLAQFSGLEQLMNMSAAVEDLALAQAVSNGSQMVQFIGKEVLIEGNSITLGEAGELGDMGMDKPRSGADLNFSLDGEASMVTVSVYDQSGTLVRTIETGPFESGESSIRWDGLDKDGNQAAPGDYTFEISATNTGGDSVGAHTRWRGVITGLTYENGYPELLIGDQRVQIGSIIEVRQP